MKQLDVTAAIEKLKMRQSTGKQSTKGHTDKADYEFIQPVYNEPIVISKDKGKEYATAGIPRRYYDMSFEWLKQNGKFPKENAEAYRIVIDYRQNLKENLSTGKGLILRGPAGTGKTSLGVCLLKEALVIGKGVLMISMPNLLDNMLTLSKGDSVAFMSYEQKLRNVPLLLLDDFGAEYSKSEWVSAKVESIIIDRYNRMRPIILTTNYSDSWTKDNYSQRIYDRLRGEYQEAVFMGASHR
ncbi:ATP-binding protein [Veillonella parvula]|uniref:ATP-binding protein n=1 Tax=Veillonella parvula TaxID=29466 RepID=UPI003AB5A8E6